MYALILSLAVAAGVAALVYSVAAGPAASRTRIASNLGRGFRSGRSLPSADGAGAPGKATNASLIGRLAALPFLANKNQRGRLDRMLAKAGRPAAWPVDRILSTKVALGVIGLVVMILVFMKATSMIGYVIGLVIPFVAFFAPEIKLYNMALERREQIQLELADTLDQMSIAVEAGLGFDAAMVRVSKNGNGVLSQELIRTLQDVQLGQTRRVAYEALAERTQVADLRQFIRSILQAEAYGLALSSVLNTQAAEMRLKRRQRAEAKAMQIPVKVVIPLMLCILPVLFMVVLGPGIIRIVGSLG